MCLGWKMIYTDFFYYWLRLNSAQFGFSRLNTPSYDFTKRKQKTTFTKNIWGLKIKKVGIYENVFGQNL